MSRSTFAFILFSLFLFVLANSLKLPVQKDPTLIASFLSNDEDDKDTIDTTQTFKIPLKKLEMSKDHKKKFYDFVYQSQTELYTNFLVKSEKTDETSSSIRKISLLNFQNIQVPQILLKKYDVFLIVCGRHSDRGEIKHF